MASEERRGVINGGAEVHEARGFERLFHNNPDVQAEFIGCLVGFLATHTEFGTSPPSEPIVRAIETIIRDFTERYPEYMREELERDPEVGGGTYRVDKVIEREVYRILSIGQKCLFDGYRL